MESAKQLETNRQPCNGSPNFQANSVVPRSREVKTIRCFSELSEENFSYTWKLYDFNEIPFVNNYPIYSPAFYINKPNDCRWQIAMTKHTCFDEGGHDEGDYISGGSDCEDDSLNASELKKWDHKKIRRIGFRLVKYENTCLVWDTVRYSFTLKFSDGTMVTTNEREDPGIEDFDDFSEPRYLLLTEKDFEDGKLFNEKYLEVTCNVIYKYIAGGTKQSPVNYEGKPFSEDLRLLFVNNRHRDMMLKVNGEFYDIAHKIILLAAIPGLENILEDTNLSMLNVDLEGDSEVCQAMVNFIYSGKIEAGFPLEKCVDLHEAAERYGVDCLGQYSSEYFINNLDSGICRKCLGITDGLADCLISVKKLSAEKVNRILANEDCSHKNQSK